MASPLSRHRTTDRFTQAEGQEAVDVTMSPLAFVNPFMLPFPRLGGFGRLFRGKSAPTLQPGLTPNDLESLRYHVELLRNTQLRPRGPKPMPELADVLRETGGVTEGAGFGRLSELAKQGQINRSWPGVYKESLSKGRTQPRSYRAPKTYHFEE